jgi:hypothetical protein
MKKLITIVSATLISLTFMPELSHAQVTGEDLQARFGIRGGLNFSNLYTKNGDEDSDMKVGYNVGLFGKLPITRQFAIQPELYYTTKGAKTSYSSMFVNGTADFNLNYLELPILAVVNITDNINIHAGPYFSYLVSGKVRNDSNISLFDFEDNINNDDYNKFDAGLAVGLGVDVGRVGIGARYNYGLSKVGKDKSFAGFDYKFPDAVNGVASLYISISLL